MNAEEDLVYKRKIALHKFGIWKEQGDNAKADKLKAEIEKIDTKLNELKSKAA